MKDVNRLLWLAVGLTFGVVGAIILVRSPQPAYAANDRYEDYIICTGPVTMQPRVLDGVWLLDYRAGKLLGTILDRSVGKVQAWAEVDLVREFAVPPRQNVHFMMTTGTITDGQAALYVAETTTGRFGVYTMGPRPDNRPGVIIRRHDLVTFRQTPPN